MSGQTGPTGNSKANEAAAASESHASSWPQQRPEWVNRMVSGQVLPAATGAPNDAVGTPPPPQTWQWPQMGQPSNPAAVAQQQAYFDAERLRIQQVQRQMADAQMQMFKEQEKQRKDQAEIYLKYMKDEQTRIDDTFKAMFGQTRGASHMFWITFLLGVFLVVVSVVAFFLHPQGNNPLVAAFFGVGALSMLSFFLRDPADKIQRAAGKLVQLQIALRYNLYEAQYWGVYFNTKMSAGTEVKVDELSKAISSMREGVQVIMRQLDESLDDRGAGKPSLIRPRARKAKTEPAPVTAQVENQ
jgi:hypothetical protein